MPEPTMLQFENRCFYDNVISFTIMTEGFTFMVFIRKPTLISLI